MKSQHLCYTYNTGKQHLKPLVPHCACIHHDVVFGQINSQMAFKRSCVVNHTREGSGLACQHRAKAFRPLVCRYW